MASVAAAAAASAASVLARTWEEAEARVTEEMRTWRAQHLDSSRDGEMWWQCRYRLATLYPAILHVPLKLTCDIICRVLLPSAGTNAGIACMYVLHGLRDPRSTLYVMRRIPREVLEQAVVYCVQTDLTRQVGNQITSYLDRFHLQQSNVTASLIAGDPSQRRAALPKAMANLVGQFVTSSVTPKRHVPLYRLPHERTLDEVLERTATAVNEWENTQPPITNAFVMVTDEDGTSDYLHNVRQRNYAKTYMKNHYPRQWNQLSPQQQKSMCDLVGSVYRFVESDPSRARRQLLDIVVYYSDESSNWDTPPYGGGAFAYIHAPVATRHELLASNRRDLDTLSTDNFRYKWLQRFVGFMEEVEASLSRTAIATSNVVTKLNVDHGIPYEVTDLIGRFASAGITAPVKDIDGNTIVPGRPMPLNITRSFKAHAAQQREQMEAIQARAADATPKRKDDDDSAAAGSDGKRSKH